MKTAARPLLILLLASAAAASLWWGLRHLPLHWWRADVIAECHGQIVARADVEAGLRDHLWRRALNWEDLPEQERQAARTAVLDDLINQRLLRLHRLSTGATSPPELDIAGEFHEWRRQFQLDGESTLRMGRQRISDRGVEERIRGALADQVSLETAATAAMPPINEQVLREWYQQHAETLRIPAATRAAHIYLTRHEKEKPNRQPEIQEIHRKLVTAEAAFPDLCAAHSEDERTKSRAGDLGWFTHERMPRDLMAAVDKLPAGQISEPVQTALGWHIVKVLDRKAARLPAFDEVRHEIEAHLISTARAAAVQHQLQEIRSRYEGSLWRANPALVDAIQPAPFQ